MKYHSSPDPSNLPKISIVTPSFNQAQFLEETIDSVLLQHYPNLEYVVIDGGSTDNTVQIIKKYERQLSYWVSEPDQGQTYAIVKGMKLVTGEIVNWLNSDDYLLPGALHAIAETYRKSMKKYCVLLGGCIRVDAKGNFLSASDIEVNDNPVLPGAPPWTGGCQASYFLSRAAWDKIGGINVNLNYTMDTDIHYRCHEAGFDFLPIEQRLAAYRVHQDTKTLRGWRESIEYKKRFYYSKLQKLHPLEQTVYQPRVARLIANFYLQSITSKDTLRDLLEKLILARRENKMAVALYLKKKIKSIINNNSPKYIRGKYQF